MVNAGLVHIGAAAGEGGNSLRLAAGRRSRLLPCFAIADVRLADEGGRRPCRGVVDGRAIDSRAFAREAAWRRSDAVKVRVVRRGA